MSLYTLAQHIADTNAHEGGRELAHASFELAMGVTSTSLADVPGLGVAFTATDRPCALETLGLITVSLGTNAGPAGIHVGVYVVDTNTSAAIALMAYKETVMAGAIIAQMNLSGRKRLSLTPGTTYSYKAQVVMLTALPAGCAASLSATYAQPLVVRVREL